MQTLERKSDLSIDADPLSIQELFTEFYAVPDFQREFVWKDKNVERLLEDICDELYDENGSSIPNAEYFIGSIVVYRAEDGFFQLIDGQQRTTTLFIILCVLDEKLENLRTLRKLICEDRMDEVTRKEEPMYRVRLLYDDAADALVKIAARDIAGLKSSKQTTSVKNLLEAYEEAKEFLNERFGDDPQRWNNFFFDLTRKVKLIRVVTPSQTGALRVFETINNTGVGLSPMDLLKNLLFRKVKRSDFSKVTETWKELSDEVAAAGESNPMGFLRYFVLSRFEIKANKPLSEDMLYQWLVENAEAVGIEHKPLDFLKELLAAAGVYRLLSHKKDPRGVDNRYLSNIQALSSRAKQHFILLLAARGLEASLFDRLCAALENLFFTFVIAKEGTKVFEATFFKATEALRTLAPDDGRGLDRFIAEWIEPEIKKRALLVNFSLSKMRQGDLQKYRLRYILAKLTQYLDEKAWGTSPNTDLGSYLIGGGVHVEHILPATATEGLKQQFDKPAEYNDFAVRLGNLTLLEMSINTSIGQNYFSEKVREYEKSRFILTKTIGAPFQIGVNTQPNRAVAELKTWKTWGSVEIEERQTMLVNLAQKVWEISS